MQISGGTRFPSAADINPHRITVKQSTQRTWLWSRSKAWAMPALGSCQHHPALLHLSVWVRVDPELRQAGMLPGPSVSTPGLV